MVLLECVERVRAERFARVVPLCRLCEMTEMIINEIFENQFGENCSNLFNSRAKNMIIFAVMLFGSWNQCGGSSLDVKIA